MRLWLGTAALAFTLMGCDPTVPVPTVSIGLNRPAPGFGQGWAAPELARRFFWGDRPGAAAYVVVVSTDRRETEQVARSGFTADHSLSVAALAWQELHPFGDRSYFWSVRAYDRPDPQGLLLAQSEPREFRPEAWEAATWRLDGPRWP